MRVIGLDVHRSFARVAVLAGTDIVEERRLDLEHDETVALRRTVSEGVALVRSIGRTKSRIHALLHANLVPN